MERLVPDTASNVLLPLRLPTQKELRSAVANMIRDIQRERGETDQDTADRLGISIGTVRNARNEGADLNALTIARIGAVYGASYVNPYNALYGATATAVRPDSEDPLCHLARAVALICEMRTPDSDGGVIETPKELLDALPDMKRARTALDGMIARTEKLRLVA
jgi:transcriptional regulator with XRE-family HTH domain